MNRSQSFADLELRHLRLVSTVAETQSLSAAAKALHLTPSALSHQLRIAEDICGPLFVRAGRRMVPTRIGRLVEACARRVEQSLRETRDAVRLLEAGERDVLRISTECYTTYYWFPRVIPELRVRFPHVDVQVVTEATREPIQALREGKLDLALASDLKSDPCFDAHHLFDDELVLLVPPGHRLAERRRVTPAAASGETLFFYSSVSPAVTDRYPSLRDLRPARVYRLELTDSILDLVRAGQGVTVMQRWAAERHIQDGALVPISLSPKLQRRWYAVTLAKEERPHVKVLVQLLRERGAPTT